MNGVNTAKLIDINDSNVLLKAHLVVSTPGIAVKAFKKGILDHSKVKTVVFDEADILIGQGEEDHCTKLAKNFSSLSNCQFLAFTATVNESLTTWFTNTFKKYNKILVN